MSNDDPTRDIRDNEVAKTTQPGITAVFRLLNETKLELQNISARLDATNARIDDTNTRLDHTNTRLDDTNARLDDTNARLDATNARLDTIDARLATIDARLDTIDARIDAVESRLAGDIEGLNTRVVNGFRELSNKIDALNRSRLQTEADYIGLLQRVTDLESKAS